MWQELGFRQVDEPSSLESRMALERLPLGRSDVEIRQEILLVLNCTRQQWKIDIAVERGCVTLTGSVSSEHERQEIEDSAAAVSGVRLLISYLQVA